ncbi:uncharacterized protein LOC115160552 [Salmo trutta]|uniref:Uncharacterized LOC115160552 n=1 Tax=Salmo trutta TaxID=8032 RepID=A0A673WIS7_SALTR|nr:uncharacterized protein LOC115160552 [Salmo trutta]
MLCESRLWSMTYCSDQDRLDPLPPVIEPPRRSVKAGSELAAATLLQASPGQPSRNGHSILSRVPQNQRPSQASAQIQPQAFSPPQDLHSQSPHPDRHISPEMEIPGQAFSGGEVPFLVPSFCQSICQNYSDLHIGGDQVLPLLAHNGEVLPCSDNQANGPFLHSCDVLPAAEDSPPDRATEDGLLRPLQWGSGSGSSRWRAGSGRDRSVLLQGLEGPLSNSLLNRYLENKILDLYQQYMLENMAHDGGYVEGLPCPLLASELILTSLDQITLQLSREGHLEAGRAKDMVLSCLLRVASGLQSSEISTPLLQISTDLQLPTDTATGAAASGATATSTATGAAASGAAATSTATGAAASGAAASGAAASGAAASGATASGAAASGAAASGATATSTSTVAIIADAAKPQGPLSSTIDSQLKNII